MEGTECEVKMPYIKQKFLTLSFNQNTMRLALNLCFLFLASHVLSQKTVSTLPVINPLYASSDAALSVFSNAAKDTSCLFLSSSDINTCYLLGKDQQPVRQFNFIKQKVTDKVLGGFFKDGNIIYVLGKDLDDKSITICRYNIEQNQFESVNTDIKTRKEYPMAFINTDHGIYILASNKNTSQLILHTISDYDVVSSDTLTIAPPVGDEGFIAGDSRPVAKRQTTTRFALIVFCCTITCMPSPPVASS